MSPTENLEEGKPLVSVIVPTHNSSTTLGRTIKSILNQTWNNIEIIVIDNRSTDNTLEVARNFPKVTAYEGGPERSSQLNLGARMARGEFLYRVDSDFVLQPNVVEEAVTCCKNGADAVVIHNTSDSSVSFWARVRKVERDTLVDDWKHVSTRFMKKMAFKKIGGFKTSLYAEEDRDLHERLLKAGYEVRRIGSIEVHLGEPKSLAEIVRKHVYYGKNMREYLKEEGLPALVELGPLRDSYLRHWREIVRDPLVLVGFLIYQYVRYASAVAGFLTGETAHTAALASPSIRPVSAVPASLDKARPPAISVVIVTRNRQYQLQRCLDSLTKSHGEIAEIIVVDDASDGGPPSLGAFSGRVRLIRNVERSFLAASRNAGARQGTGAYVMFVDDDNIVAEGATRRLRGVLEGNHRIAVASPVICYKTKPDTVWFAGGSFRRVSGVFVANWRGSSIEHIPKQPYRTETVHDAFMIRREAFSKIGYFDELNFPMYLSEADWCARMARGGYGAVVVPNAVVMHDLEPLQGARSLLRGIHIVEPTRAYFVGRNRILYMRRNRDAAEFVAYITLFQPLLVLVHLSAIVIGHGKMKLTYLLGSYLRGVVDGLTGSTRLGARLLKRVSGSAAGGAKANTTLPGP